jgi:Mn-dependent DtxR family transcriptional regulator
MKTLTPERKAILAAMEVGRDYSPSDIAALIGKERSSVVHMMVKLRDAGILHQIAYGRYVVTHK